MIQEQKDAIVEAAINMAMLHGVPTGAINGYSALWKAIQAVKMVGLVALTDTDGMRSCHEATCIEVDGKQVWP